MSDGFNVYDHDAWAASYSRLEFPGTYHLAFRDLPEIIGRPEPGARALDFGCGAGRSTRFVRELGFDHVVGVDISTPMLRRAREIDPGGDYRRVPDGDLTSLDAGSFDLVLCAFPFDNIPGRDHKVRLFEQLRRTLTPTGRLVNLVSSVELYLNDWASFHNTCFPENREAGPGDVVRVTMLDFPERGAVEDILWPEPEYLAIYDELGLELVRTHRPLGREEEPFDWVSETRIAPWTIHVLRRRTT